MPTIKAEYYSDELVDWTHSIDFNYSEMHLLTEKLAEVISRNSITGIAEKVELQQDKINSLQDTFRKLQLEIEQQETALKIDDTLIEDTKINSETEKRQAALRSHMQATEKEYIDVKFDCYHFLSGTLKK